MREIARRGRTKVGALVTDNLRDCGRDPNTEIDAIDYQKSENFPRSGLEVSREDNGLNLVYY